MSLAALHRAHSCTQCGRTWCGTSSMSASKLKTVRHACANASLCSLFAFLPSLVTSVPSTSKVTTVVIQAPVGVPPGPQRSPPTVQRMRSCSNLHKHGHYGVLHFTSHRCEPVQCLEQSLLVLSTADQWQCFNSQNWHKHALPFLAEAAASHTLRIQKIRLSLSRALRPQLPQQSAACPPQAA